MGRSSAAAGWCLDGRSVKRPQAGRRRCGTLDELLRPNQRSEGRQDLVVGAEVDVALQPPAGHVRGEQLRHKGAGWGRRCDHWLVLNTCDMVHSSLAMEWCASTRPPTL